MSFPKDIADTIHDTINDMATAAEDLHRSLAGAPFDAVGSLESFERPIKEVREAQDRSIAAIYTLIRRVNDRVSKITADLLPS